MYEAFTDEARKIFQSANGLADSFGHDAISTAHILLALLRGRHGIGWNALEALGVDMDQLEKEAVESIERAESCDGVESLGRAKRLIECAIKQSGELGHGYIGTEHILLGILDEGEGVAAQLLKKRKVTLSAAKEEVKRLLG
jgi:ATP-dependent Clp protease ATP-binding subunit ClpC